MIDGSLHPPTIAIVDSGIDATRADFGGRVVADVTMTSRTPNSAGDGRGHGTFVAAIAAGSATGYAGAEKNGYRVLVAGTAPKRSTSRARRTSGSTSC